MDQQVLTIILFAMLVTATFTDLHRSKIPNWLTLPAIATGLSIHAYTDGFSGFLYSAQGLGIGLAVLLILYCLGGLGAGDVKLFGAVGSLVGPAGILSAVIGIGLVGGLCAVWSMLQQWGWRKTVQWMFELMKTLPVAPAPPGDRLSFRFGPVIALGTILSQLGLFTQITT